MKPKLAIISTHPIQYNAPVFKLLAGNAILDIMVFYTWGETVLENKYDPGFGKVIEWDIPLLDGYPYQFVKNTAEEKGSHHFNGIVNPTIIEDITTWKPDALLVFGWSFKSHLKILRHFKNKLPVYFRGDSTLLDAQSLIGSLKRTIFLRWVYHHIDAAFYVGKSNYDYFRKFGVKKKQLIFGPHAIDNNRFDTAKVSQNPDTIDYREILSIPKVDFVFLFAGKFEQKKDPFILLESFTEANFNDNVHLVLTGNGILESDLKNGYETKRNIHFLNFQNQYNMPLLYAAADVFVLPSKGPGETWGLAVNEAMANGKFVIVSDKCGCARDLVEEGTGFIFESGNKQMLIQQLREAWEKRNDMVNIRTLVKSKISQYTFEALASAIEKQLIRSEI